MKFIAAQLLFLLLVNWNPALGTIVLVQITTGRIVVAADSRIDAEGSPWKSDEYCKVIELDPRTIFFASGNVGVVNIKTKKEVFTFASTAREVFNKHAHDDIGILAKIWREEALRRLLGVKTEPRKDFANAFWVRSDNKGLRRIEIVFSGNSKGEIAAGEPKFNVLRPSKEWFGNDRAGPLAFEFLNNQTSRAKEANSAFETRVKELIPIGELARQYEARRLESAIQAAIEWISDKNSIGGQVDSLVLRQNSMVDWITKKDCSSPQ